MKKSNPFEGLNELNAKSFIVPKCERKLKDNYYEFHAHNMNEAYNGGAFSGSLNKHTFKTKLEHIFKVKVYDGETHSGIWYNGNYITWYKRLSSIPKWTIVQNVEDERKVVGTILAHGWVPILQKLRHSVKTRDINHGELKKVLGVEY